MSLLTNFNQSQQIMNSKELLELINQVRAQFREPQLRLNSFNLKIEDELEGENYTKNVVRNFNNTESTVYELTIEQCTLIGMRESKAVRKNVLEIIKQKGRKELSRMELIQLALQAEQENIELRNQVTELAPKAEALDTIADTTNTYCIRDCAKTIGIKESELIQLLLDKKWVYRDADRKLQPHAQYVLNKVFTNRTSPVIVNRNDGKERVFLHMRVTAFGLTRITGLVNKNRKVAA